jgi:hypothetical protein
VETGNCAARQPAAGVVVVVVVVSLAVSADRKGRRPACAEGKAEDILVVFGQRGIDVDGRSRERIGRARTWAP